MQQILYRLRSKWADVAAVGALTLLVVLASLPGLRCGNIDTPDSSMHLLDGIFFYDLMRDHPHAHLIDYVLHYYKQYPALGFAFWPPLFPFVLGLVFFVTGPDMLGARLCILLFGFVFAWCFYGSLRAQFAPLPAFAAAALAVTIPGMNRQLNQLLLEFPAVAMICLAVFTYRWLLSGLERNKPLLVRAVVCGLSCAAVIYTKQPGWFIYPVLAIDLLVRRRQSLRRREIWVAVATLVVAALPLCMFTLTWGRANLAQSVGSHTNSIMASYQSLPRTSLAAWIFYPRFAHSALGWTVLLLGGVGLCAILSRRTFVRQNALWIAWFCLAYLTFSFYDNRQERFSTFWWPAWIVFALTGLCALSRLFPKSQERFAPVLFLLLVAAYLTMGWHVHYAEFSGEDRVIAHLFKDGTPGNILVIGDQVQVATALIRENDPRRQVHVIRGNNLLARGVTVERACERYRISTVLVETQQGSPAVLPVLSTSAALHPLNTDTFQKNGRMYQAVSYRYTGPMAPIAAEVVVGRDSL